MEPDVLELPMVARYSPVEGAIPGYCVVDALNTPVPGPVVQPVIPYWLQLEPGEHVNTSVSNFGFRTGIGTSCAFAETASTRPMCTKTVADINRVVTENIVVLLN